MKSLQKDLLRSAICAALALGPAGNVRADAFAQAILAIDNFRLLHPDGTSYNAFDFAMQSGTSDTQVTGQLNRQFSSDTNWTEFASGAPLDAALTADGATIYAAGTLSFAATTGLLNAGEMYQVTILQSASAGALRAGQPQRMPEPATLTVFGTGLLAIAALARRRRPVAFLI